MTLYLTNPPLNLDVPDAMYAKRIGLLDTPNQGKTLNLKHVTWAADSGCFGGRFREQTWGSWLKKRAIHAETCLFATAPDIVGDGNGSIRRSVPWLPRLRRWGYQAALVAQNGMERM